MTSHEKAELIAQFADDMKAERIETLDVRKKTSVADFFIVCSGTSDVHVQSIADKVAERLAAQRIKPLRTDDKGQGWVLQDFGDVVLHVMREEKRQFYDLETLWKTTQIDPNLVD
ncbi:MAG TPA: ribosome silencing factor [Fimbriimonadaceae bacterium]|nr:ribosome silencing factor [Fimbriimonadaceae bacterium]HRJ33647.1 ribosome silencing factor [Fimbriimonadaceae bacterium]